MADMLTFTPEIAQALEERARAVRDEEKPPKYDEKKLKELAEYIQALYEQFKASPARKKMMDDLEQSRKCYDQDYESTDYPWEGASNLITPLTTIAVDQLEPRFVSSVIGRDPIIKATHKPGLSTMEEAEDVTKFDNFILTNEVKVFKFTSRAVHRALIDGTVYPVLSWALKERRQREILFDQDTQMPLTEGDEYLTQEVNKRYYDGPIVELVLTDYVYLPDDVEDDEWEEQPVIREIYSYNLASLRRRAKKEPGWMLPEEDKDLLIEVVEQYEPSSADKQQTTERQHFGVMPDKLKPIPCLEAYVSWDLEEEGEYKAYIITQTMATQKIWRVRDQIDVMDTNVKPLRRIRFRPEEGSSWGKSLYKLIKAVQLGLDGVFNRCVNSVDISGAPWFFYKRTLGIKEPEIVIAPGMGIPVDDPQSINFPQSNMNMEAFISLITQYISFYERLTNIVDMSQRQQGRYGGPGKSGATATGTLAILQEGKISQEYTGKTLHEQFLDLFVNIHDLCASNMSAEIQNAAVGHPITKYTMSRQYDFELSGSDIMSNRYIARKENEDFLATTTQVPGALQMLDPMWMIKQVLYNYDKNPAEAINPELNALVQQWLQQKAATAEMEKMGLPKEIAGGAAEQGITPHGAQRMLTEAGETMGRMMGGEEGVPQ